MSEARSNDAYAANRAQNISLTYAVNGLNQYSAVAGNTYAYAYDGNGNLTSDGINTYVYDAENRLVTRTGGVSLSYDPNGRLWQVTGPSGTTRLEYDGDKLVEEFSGAGTQLRVYAHGPGTDEPLVWWEVSPSWQRHFLHADHQGSITAIADDSGASLGINAYDAWGVPNSTNQGRFGYTGQTWLAELGMWYYKARIYSPMLGRFLQTDPIGFGGGINLYGYVDDDPENHRDPTGEAEKPSQPEGGCGSHIPGVNNCSGRSGADYGAGQSGDKKQQSHIGMNGFPQPGPPPELPIDGETMATMQDSIDMRDVMAGRMTQERLTERREARALGASFTPIPTATAELLTIRTTLHGAERIAGAAATRGGVLSRTGIVLARMFGKRMTQRDGATVFVRAQLWGGRYDVYVENRAGKMITGVGGISEKTLARLAKRYGYH